MNKLAVVILNYNGIDHLQRFLPSVVAHSPTDSVWVIDNCSTDNSIEFIKSQYPTVKIIELNENGGYSRGYNQGLAQITAEYYVLLNSDVEVTENWWQPIVELMDSDNLIAAAQPKVLDYFKKDHFEYAGAGGGFIDTLGYPFCRGRLFLTLEEDFGQYDDVHRVFWASGACLFIRASAYWENGGLDEDFFAHMEEIDLCWRLNNAGLKVMYHGQSKVYHVGGGTLNKSNPRKTFLNFRNGLSLIYKNYKRWELVVKLPIRITLDVIASIKFMLFDSFADGIAVFKAHLNFIKQLPLNYKKRRGIKKRVVGGAAPPIFSKSIVYHYFVRGVRRFQELID